MNCLLRFLLDQRERPDRDNVSGEFAFPSHLLVTIVLAEFRRSRLPPLMADHPRRA